MKELTWHWRRRLWDTEHVAPGLPIVIFFSLLRSCTKSILVGSLSKFQALQNPHNVTSFQVILRILGMISSLWHGNSDILG